MKTISFFSFKGGVGCTALLTNLGVYWAGRGKVVVLMDLDLMAPGLAYSPLAGPHLYPEGEGLGMSDLIAVLQRLTGDPAKNQEAARDAFLPPHWLLREMRLHPEDGQGQDKNQGQLLLIDAGSHPVTGRTPETDGVLPPIPPRRGTLDESEPQALYRSLAYQMRDDPPSAAEANSDKESIATLVERHTRLAKETLARTQNPASQAARSLFIASLAAGAADEGLWQGIRSGLKTHQDRFDLIHDLYLFAGLWPDTAPAAAQRVTELLALPAEQIAGFRDQPKPPDWLERYRPFAEGRSRGAGDPDDRARFCRED